MTPHPTVGPDGTCTNCRSPVQRSKDGKTWCAAGCGRLDGVSFNAGATVEFRGANTNVWRPGKVVSVRPAFQSGNFVYEIRAKGKVQKVHGSDVRGVNHDA